MEKLIHTKTGKEVKLGDLVFVPFTVTTPFGKLTSTQLVKISEETIDKLIDYGVLSADCSFENTHDIEYYCNKIAEKLGWKSEKLNGYFKVMYSINPSSIFSLLLKEIAIDFDKKYKNHISESPEIYVISTTNGRIGKLDKSHIKNYKNFAAFRTSQEAFKAYTILKPLIEDMFGNEK